MNTTYTPLSFLLMNMLNRKAQSGYALCQLVKKLPIGAVSASPGSIYPCLKKLENNGSISGEVVGGNTKLRRKFRLTAKGKRALQKWMREPLTATAVIKSPEILFVRLSFFEAKNSTLTKQLASLRTDLLQEQESLNSYRESVEEQLETGGKLAIDLASGHIEFLTKWVINVESQLAD